jgi:hypothetical protein
MESQPHSSQGKGYMLFNIALEKAVRVAGLDITGTILHKSIQILVYADHWKI